MTTGIEGLGHLALKVTDLDRSLRFWRDGVGLQEMERLRGEDGTAWLVYLRITDTQFLELLPGAKTDRAPADGVNGVNHICLTVRDLDQTAAALAAQGIALTSPISRGLDGNRGAWIVDPDGNRIELMEMHPDCLQYRAVRALQAAV